MYKLILSCLFAFGVINHASAQEADCQLQFAQINMCASMEWIVEPDTNAEAKALLRYWDVSSGSSQGPYADPTEVPFVKLWMEMGNGHGHGSAPTNVSRQEQGVYLVTRMYFAMRGPWQVHVQRKTSQGQVVESAIIVKEVLK